MRNDYQFPQNFESLKQYLAQDNILIEVSVFKEKTLIYSHCSDKKHVKCYFDAVTEFALLTRDNFFFWSSIWHGHKTEAAYVKRLQDFAFKEGVTVVRQHEEDTLLFSIACLQHESQLYEFMRRYCRLLNMVVDELFQLYKDNGIIEFQHLILEFTHS